MFMMAEMGVGNAFLYRPRAFRNVCMIYGYSVLQDFEAT